MCSDVPTRYVCMYECANKYTGCNSHQYSADRTTAGVAESWEIGL
jgi:hypothetical protein